MSLDRLARFVALSVRADKLEHAGRQDGAEELLREALVTRARMIQIAQGDERDGS